MKKYSHASNHHIICTCDSIGDTLDIRRSHVLRGPQDQRRTVDDAKSCDDEKDACDLHVGVPVM